MKAVRWMFIYLGAATALIAILGYILAEQFPIYSWQWNVCILIWVFGAYNCLIVLLIHWDYTLTLKEDQPKKKPKRTRDAKTETRPDKPLRKGKPGTHRMR